LCSESFIVIEYSEKVIEKDELEVLKNPGEQIKIIIDNASAWASGNIIKVDLKKRNSTTIFFLDIYKIIPKIKTGNKLKIELQSSYLHFSLRGSKKAIERAEELCREKIRQ
jgi:hypothetical protein